MEKDILGEYKRGRYPLTVRLIRVIGEGDSVERKHVATVEIKEGEKVVIRAETDALAKHIADKLKKPVTTMTGGNVAGIFWDGFIELKPGDPGHAEAVMYTFKDLVPQYGVDGEDEGGEVEDTD